MKVQLAAGDTAWLRCWWDDTTEDSRSLVSGDSHHTTGVNNRVCSVWWRNLLSDVNTLICMLAVMQGMVG